MLVSAKQKGICPVRYQQIFGLFILFLMFSGCQKEQAAASKKLLEDQPSKAYTSAANDGVNVTSVCFKVIAAVKNCKADVTENVEISGFIENRTYKTINANGTTNYTRHFIVKGLTGKGTMGTTLTANASELCGLTASAGYTGTEYEVVGGAEMFSIHYDGTGGLPVVANSNVYIHQGTLVLVNKATHQRIIARHTIRKTSNSTAFISKWDCGGN